MRAEREFLIPAVCSACACVSACLRFPDVRSVDAITSTRLQSSQRDAERMELVLESYTTKREAHLGDEILITVGDTIRNNSLTEGKIQSIYYYFVLFLSFNKYMEAQTQTSYYDNVQCIRKRNRGYRDTHFTVCERARGG